ncbi:MAG: 3-dehydro-L-gulonate 2-dehydrogenase [Anaerolineae bacterium]|nr:3-dehydro-L-gulonate 2-dehydrogenase [Anaerolineae bacterium]
MTTIHIPFEDMKRTFHRVLVKVGFTSERADRLADVFAQNSLDGVASHGWNRFPALIKQIDQGYVKVDAEPERVVALGAWEQWDGNLGPGPLNALTATDRAMELAREYGIGCVGLRNTNHWMRAGTYGQVAARAGFVLLCWTNAVPVMPPYGSRDIRLGNNPLVLAVPHQGGPVVLDIAMSQFSFGKMEVLSRRGEKLPVPGGVDQHGQPTQDATVILESGRALPIGYWKGSGLALLLDMTATLVTGGQATYQIRQCEAEFGISQVFVAFDITRPSGTDWVEREVQNIITDMQQAKPETPDAEVMFPGERVLRTRQENMANGIPVDETAWQAILTM